MTNDVHSLAAPYALYALDEAERERFEVHLESCADCQSEVAGFFATAVRLGDRYANDAPPHVKSSIMTAVSRTPQERPVVTAIAMRGRLRRTLPRLAAAAAVTVGLAGLGAFALEHERTDDLREQQAAMTSVMAAEDAETTAEPIESGGSVRMVMSKSEGAAVLVASALPSLDDAKTYQMWTIRDGQAASAGLLGSASSMNYMDKLQGVDTIAITVEPDGGSESPTSPAVIALPAA